MRIDGYGGRGNRLQFSERVVNGLLSTDKKLEPTERECANIKCHSLFQSRQEGDDFCSDACDTRFKPPKELGYVMTTFVETIAEAIRSFDFDDYGLDDLEEIKDLDWVDDLAQHIWDSFL